MIEPTRLQLLIMRLFDWIRELVYRIKYREVKVVTEYVDGEGYEFEMHKRFVSPIGRPRKPFAVVVRSADRMRHPIGWNRYPHQVIGLAIRLPHMGTSAVGIQPEHSRIHLYVSIVWARPASWKDHD